jgi:uncharacterized damage-inducible protein DinB
MTSDDFLRMFDYDHWANRECLRALRSPDAQSHSTPNNASLPALPAAAVKRIAHVLSAEKLWLQRLRRQPQSLPVWPTSTIDDCFALADEMSAAWRDYLTALAPDALDRSIDYRNSKGEPWSNRVEDILLHVIMHSAYHRGQIAMEMRAHGIEPAYTDFINAVRNGFVK